MTSPAAFATGSPCAIDVIVPVFNAASTLDASLETIARQTFTDFRVIAIDDGSTDGSNALLAAWAGRDSRFRVITKANGGIVEALNLGLEMVTAPIVARMDADDLSFPERFALQHAYLQAHPDCVAVGGDVEHIDAAGLHLSGMPHPGVPTTADADWVPAREPYIVHPFLMARADVMRAAGSYRNVPYSEDSDLYWRLSQSGRLHNLSSALGRYRMHSGSISGAGAVNGRIMAIGSQLGAVSARRRRDGLVDLAFSVDLVQSLRERGSLEAMYRLVAALLAPAERSLFRIAVAIKLLELAEYRPYEIDGADCTFIARSLELVEGLAPANAREVRWYVTRAGARLLRRGRMLDAARLVPTRWWTMTMARRLCRN